MYAVIFRAELGTLDQTYFETAERMRELARTKYGCIEFMAMTEEMQEIAVSYWDNEHQIAAWKNDPEHKAAQKLGRSKWYKSYNVQILKVEREYSGNT